MLVANLKEQIHFMVSQTLLEIRSNFKWSEFKELETPKGMAYYLEKTGTEKLGSGSSRWVYLLSNRYVLKLADPLNPRRGLAQNHAELEVATDSV